MAGCFQADLRVFCELIKLLSLLVNCSSENEAINGDFDCFRLEILQRAPFLQGNRKLICYEIELVINSSQIASLFLRELSKLDITGGGGGNTLTLLSCFFICLVKTVIPVKLFLGRFSIWSSVLGQLCNVSSHHFYGWRNSSDEETCSRLCVHLK